MCEKIILVSRRTLKPRGAIGQLLMLMFQISITLKKLIT